MDLGPAGHVEVLAAVLDLLDFLRVKANSSVFIKFDGIRGPRRFPEPTK